MILCNRTGGLLLVIFAKMYTLKKSLGQHFLKDEQISKKIVDELRKCSFNNLLEIGPGGGALTKYLVKIPDISFKAVEIDEEKIIYLITHYPELKDKIIHSSFLEIDPPFTEPFAVIGNFPYNISTQILFKIMEWTDSIICVIGMFQKEVALRIASKEGNKVYGVTSVLVQAFFDVEYLFDVGENSFTPPPKVKSGVLKLLPKKEIIPMKSRRAFFTLVKTAFGQRRKTLRNACKGLFDNNVLEQDIFNKRAEQLSVNEFAQLSFQLR
ncbi:MAG TPA: 16S rRNA (adenine(1518)-N(6)/adenine(1519)-N(6))-dimethyltransferase RsmA [Flavisolibacter sp.]|nr:16S rRNA (adenine(1518)-N(6)/adenine(1519)-N(6))-dimethyltransferase RsmA [Flavisolibacter sp.]